MSRSFSITPEPAVELVLSLLRVRPESRTVSLAAFRLGQSSGVARDSKLEIEIDGFCAVQLKTLKQVSLEWFTVLAKLSPCLNV